MQGFLRMCVTSGANLTAASCTLVWGTVLRPGTRRDLMNKELDQGNQPRPHSHASTDDCTRPDLRRAPAVQILEVLAARVPIRNVRQDIKLAQLAERSAEHTSR